jgi:hypothetical protein
MCEETRRTVHCHPFHDVDVFWQHDDRLEVALHESCFDEWAAQVQRLLGTRGRHGGRCGRCTVVRISIGERSRGWGWGAFGAPRGPALHRTTEIGKKIATSESIKKGHLAQGRRWMAYPMELKKDITCAFVVCRTGGSTEGIWMWRF